MHIWSLVALLSLVSWSAIAGSRPAPHGTVVFPMSRAYRVYLANPSNPSFPLAANAVAIDGELSYYTWNELSRNIPQAVQAGLPQAFQYAPWVPDGQLASGGRTNPNSTEYPRTYAGLDQVSPDWPKTTVTSGQSITVDFLATAAHSPSVWDVWMTTPAWHPTQPLTWANMQYLGRPVPVLANGHYTFPLQIPNNRFGHHVLWIAWQRNDPVGEVFFSTSDLQIVPANGTIAMTRASGCTGTPPISLQVTGSPLLGGLVTATLSGASGVALVNWNVTQPGQLLLPACACHVLALGPILHAGISSSLTSPQQASLLGLQLTTQGAALLGTGSACPVPLPLAVTDVWTVTIG